MDVYNTDGRNGVLHRPRSTRKVDDMKNRPGPPKLKTPTHATYIEERRPQWKYHTNIGQAKNACSYMMRESYLYEINSAGDLVELYHIEPNKINTLKESRYGGRPYHSWGPEFMPWNNTEEAKKKERQEKIKELERNFEHHKAEMERFRKELFEVLGSD